MIPIDHLLAIALVVVGPIRSATVGLRRLERATPETLPATRLGLYRTGALILWTLALATLAIWVTQRRPWAELGLSARPTAGLLGVGIGVAIIATVLIRRRGHTLASPDELAEVRERLGRLELLLPHTAAEFRAFAAVSLTAGICEELLYRGFLIWYFSHLLPWWAAGLASAAAFGLAHAYQGARGVIQTMLVGAFLAAVYFVAGSLWAPMLIHALMDLHTGHLAWRAYARAAEDRAERQAVLDEIAEGGPLPGPPGPDDA